MRKRVDFQEGLQPYPTRDMLERKIDTRTLIEQKIEEEISNKLKTFLPLLNVRLSSSYELILLFPQREKRSALNVEIIVDMDISKWHEEYLDEVLNQDKECEEWEFWWRNLIQLRKTIWGLIVVAFFKTTNIRRRRYKDG